MMNERKDQWTVGAWMSENPKTVAPNLSVREAFFTMRIQGLRHFLIVGEEGLMGIISDRDLRRPDITGEPDGWDEFYRLDEDYEVCDVMTTDLKSVFCYDPIEKALKIILDNKFNALPVLDKTKNLIGIITSHDLHRAFQALLKEKTVS